MSVAVADPKSLPAAPPPVRSTVSYFRHGDFKPSPLNPRKQKRDEAAIAELAQSIDDKGLLHNLVARKASDGKLEIAAGEGRWLAIGKLIASGKWEKDRVLPVQIRELSDDQMIEIGLIENVQRSDLHPLDEGAAYRDLYDNALKRAGKGAAANVVRELAKRVDKTERYVQKRIALVRDLASEVTELFAKNEIDLAAAQVFASVPVKRQQKTLKEHDQHNARSIENGRPDDVLPLTAARVMSDLRDDIRDLGEALFDLKLYKGDVLDHRGKPFALDAKAFDQLQKKAAGDLKAAGERDAKAGAIAFFQTGDHFNKHGWLVDGHPKGGVFLEIKKSWHSGPTYRLFRGLVRTPAAIAEEKRREKWEAELAATRAKSAAATKAAKAKFIAEPRIDTVVAFVAKSPQTFLALEIYNCLCEWDEGIDWFDTYSSMDGEDLLEGLEQIGKPPAGEKLLGWLLGQSLSTLAKVWFGAKLARPSSFFKTKWRRPEKGKVGADEQALFDHCGATLPPVASVATKKQRAKIARLNAAGRGKKPSRK